MRSAMRDPRRMRLYTHLCSVQKANNGVNIRIIIIIITIVIVMMSDKHVVWDVSKKDEMERTMQIP